MKFTSIFFPASESIFDLSKICMKNKRGKALNFASFILYPNILFPSFFIRIFNKLKILALAKKNIEVKLHISHSFIRIFDTK